MTRHITILSLRRIHHFLSVDSRYDVTSGSIQIDIPYKSSAFIITTHFFYSSHVTAPFVSARQIKSTSMSRSLFIHHNHKIKESICGTTSRAPIYEWLWYLLSCINCVKLQYFITYISIIIWKESVLSIAYPTFWII